MYLKNYQLNYVVKNEIIAGLTVFVTMAYILILNPIILANAGIPLAFSFVATCLATALSCFLLGLWAKFPLAIGPSMAINSYFVTSIVDKFDGDWSAALGAVFLSGVFLCIAAFFNMPKKINLSVPKNIKLATVTGLSILIMKVAISSSNIFNSGLFDINFINFFGFTFTIILCCLVKRYKIFGGSLLVIIIASLLIDYIWPESISNINSINFNEMHFVLSFGSYLDTIFNALLLAFLIIFDSTSTIFALTENNVLSTSDGFVQQKSKTLMITGLGTMLSSFLGSTNMGIYFESAAGIDAKATSGICPLIVGICFLLGLLLAPYLCYIPQSVPSAVLFLVALKISSVFLKINYKNFRIFIPVVITIFIISYFKAIADGLGFGLVLYVFLNYKNEKPKKESLVLIGVMVLYWITNIIYKFIC